MRRYSVYGKGKDTGRPRKRLYTTKDEAEAWARAVADGTIPETIKEVPPDPPTDRQLVLARRLELRVPDGASIEDVSDMLTCHLEHDKPSTLRHRSFAKLYGVYATDYIGKKALFGRIKSALDEPGRELALAAWFTYRVYRKFVQGAQYAPIEGPDDPVIMRIAEELVQDERVIASMRRYTGRDLIWFGEWTAPDGCVYAGGSTRTIAYKAAASALEHETGLPRPNTHRGSEPSARARRSRRNGAGMGCSTAAIVLGFILLLILLGVLH